MDRDFVYTMAIAVAKANGHPNPEEYGTTVLDHFDNPEGVPVAETLEESPKVE